MGGLFKKPKTPKVEKPKVENQLLAAYQAMEKLRKRGGTSSTIMTSPLGVGSPASTTKAQLGA